MKKLLITLFAICLLQNSFGQSITIDPSTPFAACGGQNITVNFTPSGGVIGPYTVELVENVTRMTPYSCSSSTTTTKASTITPNNTVSILIPNGLNSSFNFISSGFCSGNYYSYGNIEYLYFLKVTNSNLNSQSYLINLNSICNPILGPKIVPSNICSGKTALLNWYSSGANSGNVFIVEMSNSSGSFSTPTSLGTLSNNNSDGLKILSVVILSNSTDGSGYKIKVKSSDPISEKEFGLTINSAYICGPIQSPTISGPICSGANKTVNIILDDTFQAGNVFTAELSDVNGSFNSPTVIGTLTSTTATSIPITIPNSLPYSSSYRIRIKGSLPSSGIPYTSPETSNFQIGLPPASINTSQTFCQLTELSISLSTSSYSPETNYTFTWKKDGNNANTANETTDLNTNNEYFTKWQAQSIDAGVYNVTVTRNADGCSVISNNNTVSITPIVEAPSTTPITVVSGSTGSLTASNCSGGTIRWYNSLTQNNYQYIGSNTYTTAELNIPTTFYAACQSNSGPQCYSTRTPVLVSIDYTNAPATPTLTSSDNNFCYASVSNPKLTSIGCTGIVRWYSKNTVNGTYNLQETDTEAPYEYSFYSGINTTTYAADCRENGILSAGKSEIIITVKPQVSSPNFEPSYFTINSGSDIILGLSSSSCLGGTVTWYDASSAGNIINTGRTFSFTNVTASLTVYASCTKNGCESSRSSNSIYVNSNIQAPSFIRSNNEFCGPATSTLNAIGCSQGIVKWYTYANSIYSEVATGQSFTTPSLSNTGSNYSQFFEYYADCTIGSNTSNKNSTSIYVYKTPTIPSANQPTIPCNAKVTLTATNCNSSNFSTYWYADATTSSSLSSNSYYTTPNLTATTIYYLECKGSPSNCPTSRVPITVTVACTPPDAPVISTNLNTVCSGLGVNLTATGCTGTVSWSDGGTGASRTSVIFNNSVASLTAICSIGSLSSGNSNSLSITVNPKPILIITNPASVSPPNTVNITMASVTSGSILPAGTALTYHTDAGGTIAMSSPPATAVNTSGTYYIKAATAFCTDIKPVIVIISDCNTPINLPSSMPNNYNSGTTLKKTNETITASNIISGTANVTYRSNKSITLSAETGAGFFVSSGALFKAEIGGCN